MLVLNKIARVHESILFNVDIACMYGCKCVRVLYIVLMGRDVSAQRKSLV